MVGWQTADQYGSDTHTEQTEHQHALVANLVAKVPHNQSSNGPGNETHGKGRKRCQLSDQIRHVGKKQRSKDQRRRRRVDKEVVPLKGGANKTRKQDTSEPGAVAL